MLNNNTEIWKAIKDYEKLYEASTTGCIRNAKGNVLKTYTTNSGYQCLKFTVNTVRRTFLLHRLIAQTFIPNPNNLPEVNHIDEDKTNNSIGNLQWVTSSQNKQHSMQTGTYDKIYTTKNSLGKKHLPNTSSKYYNVGWDKYRCKWTACIRSNGINLERKRFNTEVEAALHVNFIVDKYSLTDRPKNIIV